MPLLATNGALLVTILEGGLPWCLPYIDGCTTISSAARSGNSIYLFRVPMTAFGVLLIVFWIYVFHWLRALQGRSSAMSHSILWLGIIGALFLLVYIDFLGTTGEINRFMRRVGILFYFCFTALGQLLLLYQHKKLSSQTNKHELHQGALNFQLGLLWLMLLIGLSSIVLGVLDLKTYEIENIVEWNYSLLMDLYFAAMIVLWKDYRVGFSRRNSE